MTQSELALSLLENAQEAMSLTTLKASGVHAETLSRLAEAGRIERPASGYYALAGRIDIMDIDWVAFSLQLPDGVLGLLTAAVHHEMTQELPGHLQGFVNRSRGGGRVTLGGNSQAVVEVVSPRNPLFLSEGVEIVMRSGHQVRLTSKERTLLDMFQFSPFNSRASERTVRIPEETFLDTLSRCVDDTDFSFDTFSSLAEAFGCEDQIRPFTKTSRYVGPRLSGP